MQLGADRPVRAHDDRRSSLELERMAERLAHQGETDAPLVQIAREVVPTLVPTPEQTWTERKEHPGVGKREHRASGERGPAEESGLDVGDGGIDSASEMNGQSQVKRRDPVRF